jgi:hypothetical protein
VSRLRPEFYIWQREQLDIRSNKAILADFGYPHVAHLLGSDASDASHASDQKTGGGTDE